MRQAIKVILDGSVMYFTRPAYQSWRCTLSTGDFHTHTHKLVKRIPKSAKVISLAKLNMETLVPLIAEQCGLTHDGGDDCRLFDETIFTNSLNMDEKQYAKMERDLAKFSVVGKGFVVYAWNDISGYEYWNVKQKENNYIQITAYISDPRKVDVEQLKKAIRKARNHFSHYEFDFETKAVSRE